MHPKALSKLIGRRGPRPTKKPALGVRGPLPASFPDEQQVAEAAPQSLIPDLIPGLLPPIDSVVRPYASLIQEQKLHPLSLSLMTSKPL